MFWSTVLCTAFGQVGWGLSLVDSFLCLLTPHQRRAYFGIDNSWFFGSLLYMTTVAEIETAIEQLPKEEYQELLAWIEERQGLLASSDALFTMYDEEEAQVDAES